MGVGWVVACEAGILKGMGTEFGLTFHPSHEPGIPGIYSGSVW